MPDPAPTPGGGRPQLPDPKTLDCLSTACQAAQAKVVNAANDIVTKCGQISDANARASAILGIAAGIFGLGASIIGGLAGSIGIAATAALLVATVVSLNWILFWLAVTLIATALALLTAYIAFLIYVAVLQGQLGGLRDAFKKAAADVMANCPNTCWGDLIMPSC
jgi:hypothetical protein